jgi:hypothetical protein
MEGILSLFIKSKYIFFLDDWILFDVNVKISHIICIFNILFSVITGNQKSSSSPSFLLL